MKKSITVTRRCILFFAFLGFLSLGLDSQAFEIEPPGIYINDISNDYATIQDAIDAADPGDIIWVEDGTYTGIGNRNIDFQKADITLRSVNGPESCTIDCQGEQGFHFHLIPEGPTPVVSGFTIINGFAANGGGMFFDGACSVIIDNCIISGNEAVFGGGGISHATSGDASFPTIKNCTISDNVAVFGGGVFSGNSSSAILENTVMSGNTADFGGAIYLENSTAAVTNCIITGNVASTDGGGAHCISGSEPTFTNTVLKDNIPNAVYRGNATSPTISYCLFFNNNSGDLYDQNTMQDYTGENEFEPGVSNVNNAPGCSANLYGNPNFAADSYTPETCASPVIDTGVSVVSPLLDMKGEERPQGFGYDIGVIEAVFDDTDQDLIFDDCDNCRVNPNTNQADADEDGIGDVCEGDFNSDGVVDTGDLDILLSHLNMPASSFPAGDLNGDGIITTLDIMALLKINPLLARDRRIRTLLSRPTRRAR